MSRGVVRVQCGFERAKTCPYCDRNMDAIRALLYEYTALPVDLIAAVAEYSEPATPCCSVCGGGLVHWSQATDINVPDDLDVPCSVYKDAPDESYPRCWIPVHLELVWWCPDCMVLSVGCVVCTMGFDDGDSCRPALLDTRSSLSYQAAASNFVRCRLLGHGGCACGCCPKRYCGRDCRRLHYHKGDMPPFTCFREGKLDAWHLGDHRPGETRAGQKDWRMFSYWRCPRCSRDITLVFWTHLVQQGCPARRV